MFSKIINKDDSFAATEPATVSETVAGSAWESRLQAAIGNDAELLALAKDAPAIAVKLSAVLALAGEDALRSAEREFRTHDRRVHSVAKQRYETLVRRREARARAAELIEIAAALIEEPTIPANRLVELYQAWDELDAGLLDDAQKSSFAGLQASLAELMRERAERKRSISRWSASARQAMAHLGAARAGAATAAVGSPELAATLAAAGGEARAALAAAPTTDSLTILEAGSIATLLEALQAALQNAVLIEARLAMLEELQRGTQSQTAEREEGESRPPPAALSETAMQCWQAQPLIADQRIENVLNARFEAWLHGQDEARRKSQAEIRQRASETKKAALQARIQALTETANATETALAEGHLAEAGKHLALLQAASGKSVADTPLQARIGALQAEFARLKGWQQWGGGRVRDELVGEAETLADSTIGPEGSRPAKVPIQQLEKTIEQLRARWKELDRLGGATSKSLWQRFDGALKTASLPVTAHLARLNEARQQNLAARSNLLAALDALSITADDRGAAPDWKEIARALAHFQTEWRKLGPLQHTVPHKLQAALTQRMTASVARLEDPLKEVLHGAQTERQQFIVRARALSSGAQGREVAAKIRELQAQWQDHARSQPLPRKLENLLWADFRAAIDAVMRQREAAFSARDAEFKAHQTAREVLLARLAELHQDTPPAEIKRVLAALETEWRNAGEVPRSQTARLESRYKAARETALGFAAGSAQRIWDRSCDALAAKLELCEEIEAVTSPLPSAVPELEARWAALPALPAQWEQALQPRFKSGIEDACRRSTVDCGETASSGEVLDQYLLQLESALGIPSPPAFQAARRMLKLLAMKSAMEGRRATGSAPAGIEKITAAALGCTCIDAGQRHRLAAIIAALRASGSGSLRG